MKSKRLYLVAPARLRAGALVDVVAELAEAGVDVVQLREKEMEARDVLRLAEPLLAACRDAGIPFIINDRPDIAIALGVLRPGPVPRIWRGLNKVIRGVASRIVVVGRDMGDKLAADGVPRSKLEFIPTWAPDDLPGAEERAAIRAAEQWEDRFIVMHAGNQGLGAR